MLKKFLTGIIGLTLAGSALAVPVVPTDLDGLGLLPGDIIAGPITDDFLGSGGDIGDLENTVYFQAGIYTYVHRLIPGTNNISEFNTGFNVKGFNGVAGFSFGDAKTAGDPTPANAFNIDHEADGTIDWQTAFTQGGSSGFDKNESIRFFFQSTKSPGKLLKNYNIINSFTGTAQSYAPTTPEPSALLLMGTGILALRLLRRRP